EPPGEVPLNAAELVDPVRRVRGEMRLDRRRNRTARPCGDVLEDASDRPPPEVTEEPEEVLLVLGHPMGAPEDVLRAVLRALERVLAAVRHRVAADRDACVLPA